jgi:hypothetical protein
VLYSFFFGRLRANSIVTILRKEDNGWWLGLYFARSNPLTPLTPSLNLECSQFVCVGVLLCCGGRLILAITGNEILNPKP